MKDYYKPLIKEDIIEVSDIVANSNTKDRYESTMGTWVMAIVLALPMILFIIFGIIYIVQELH